MRHLRPLVTSTAVAVLSIGLFAGLAPAATAADSPAGCSAAERAALRQEIATVKGQMNDLRLSPDQRAEQRAARKQAIEAIKAKYGVPGTTLSPEKRAEMKAEIQATVGQAKQARSDRRSQLDPLKAKARAAHDQLQACRAAAKPVQ